MGAKGVHERGTSIGAREGRTGRGGRGGEGEEGKGYMGIRELDSRLGGGGDTWALRELGSRLEAFMFFLLVPLVREIVGGRAVSIRAIRPIRVLGTFYEPRIHVAWAVL